MSDLTKWPLLLVTGKSVTEQQANEILIRTSNPWYLNCNDAAWNLTVASALGLDLDEHGWPTSDSINAAVDRLGILNLEYLNTSRISSSWIGGPHGWCDWNGTIGCSNYNIGKWPSVEEVTADWEAIARAFPYLDLTTQLVTDEGEGKLAAEWRVVAGIVEYREPSGLLAEPKGLDEADLLARFLTVGGERGVTVERLRQAVAQLETAA